MNDKDGVTKAMLLASILACCKHARVLPDHIKWQLNTYTNWNVSMIVARYLFSINEWDPFLCVNSIGIFLGFRTAFAQGLDDNLRKKLASMEFRISRKQFLMGDFIMHTLPAIGTTALMVHKKRKIKFINVTYGMTLLSWFVFRQVGQLDASNIYVPHPWKRSWLAVITGMMLAPEFVNSLQQNKKSRLFIIVFLFLLPYLSTKLDPNLKKTYNFEYILTKHNSQRPTKMKRVISTPNNIPSST
jgi:hypothetical protein